jgi:hypothetical protein
MEDVGSPLSEVKVTGETFIILTRSPKMKSVPPICTYVSSNSLFSRRLKQNAWNAVCYFRVASK